MIVISIYNTHEQPQTAPEKLTRSQRIGKSENYTTITRMNKPQTAPEKLTRSQRIGKSKNYNTLTRIEQLIK